MHKSAAIILAAGLSQRMGPINKLLIPIEGVPMVRRSVAAYLDVCNGKVTVVTGYQRTEVETALNGLDVQFVFNPDFEQGQKTSVAAGLSASAPAQDTFIGLGDQPFLTDSHLVWLLEQHRTNKSGKITVPVQDKMRGNPLIIPLDLKARLLADHHNPGCYKFTRENPDLLNLAATQTTAFFRDIDTPQEVAALSVQEEATS
ncbi:nucleotidyltransferase family protein [Pararhizobium sp. IMCC21322]|uniref:nucleotidyltransferase family protein n=1 Tax=Pararhizobium sp. IMCC21322 TaxID=3067903 RepID=UPI00274237C2|nr:nucleotidyltransferase family protein [Pararhizobium sp. IMCC21322]